jgi:hypothetical protein
VSQSTSGLRKLPRVSVPQIYDVDPADNHEPLGKAALRIESGFALVNKRFSNADLQRAFFMNSPIRKN